MQLVDKLATGGFATNEEADAATAAYQKKWKIDPDWQSKQAPAPKWPTGSPELGGVDDPIISRLKEKR
jgi:hypothetical protein